MINDDPDTIQTLNEERMNGMYEVQNAITAAITQIQTSTALMTTSCETRCNGMSSMLAAPTTTSGPGFSFDAQGNIVEDKPAAGAGAAAYSCREFDAAPEFDPMAFLGRPGTINIETIMGGVSGRVAELTDRVLTAVVMADRAIEMAEITTNIGRSIEDEESFGGGNQALGSKVSECINRGHCNAIAPCMHELINDASKGLNQKNPSASALNDIQLLINSVLGVLDSNNCTNPDTRTSGRPQSCTIGTGTFAIANITSCSRSISQRTEESGGRRNRSGSCDDEVRRALAQMSGHESRSDAITLMRQHGITELRDQNDCIDQAGFVPAPRPQPRN
jgi:hypothetical protein